MTSSNIHVDSTVIYDPDSDLQEMLYAAEQYDTYLNIKNHVMRYGVDEEFLFLCNRNNELGNKLHIDLPSSTSNMKKSYDQCARDILVAMEDESEGFFKSIFNFIKNMIAKFFDFFKSLFGLGKKAELRRDQNVIAREYREGKLREIDAYLYTHHFNAGARDLPNVVRLDYIREVKRILDDFHTRLEIAKTQTTTAVLSANYNNLRDAGMGASNQLALNIVGYNTSANRGTNNIMHFEDIRVTARTLRANEVQNWMNEARLTISLINEIDNQISNYSQILRDNSERLSKELDKNKNSSNANLVRLQQIQSTMVVESQALINIKRISNFVMGFEDLLFKNMRAIVGHFYQ